MKSNINCKLSSTSNGNNFSFNGEFHNQRNKVVINDQSNPTELLKIKNDIINPISKMNGKRKAGSKKVLVGCSGQEYRRIKERTEQIIFNDDSFNVNLDDLVSQKPPLLNITNQINQYNEEIDQYDQRLLRCKRKCRRFVP
jgi:hypothetical protein